jgi:hypothetical protein
MVHQGWEELVGFVSIVAIVDQVISGKAISALIKIIRRRRLLILEKP